MTTSAGSMEHNAALAARVHRLSDPLAAMNQRSHQQRIRREGRARMVLLAAALTTMLGLTGVIAIVADPPADNAATVQQSVNGPVHIRSRSS